MPRRPGRTGSGRGRPRAIGAAKETRTADPVRVSLIPRSPTVPGATAPPPLRPVPPFPFLSPFARATSDPSLPEENSFTAHHI